MSESQPESNNFEDFEKLDPLERSPTEAEGMPSAAGATAGDSYDDLVSSSTSAGQTDTPEEDLYSATSRGMAAEAEAVQNTPLVSFDDEPALPAGMGLAAAAAPSAPIQQDSPPTTSPSKDAAKEDCSAKLCCGWVKNMDPRGETCESTVLDLVFWRDVKKTGLVFASTMVLLFSLAMFSVLSVIAYLSLAMLTVTISFRIYKQVLSAVQKTGDGHPFKCCLDKDISLPAEKVHQLADQLTGHATCLVNHARRLILVADLVDSLKFGLFLWVLTYIGAWFNGMTLIILDVVALFTLPKVYETYQVPIDNYIDIAVTQTKQAWKTIQSKIPMPGKKKSE